MRALSDLLVFDTEKIAQPHRFDFWNAFVGRRLLGVTMDSSLRQTYEGRIEIHGLDRAALVFAQGGPCSAYRGELEIASTGSETPGWLLMRVNVPARVQHCGCDEQLQPGDLILIDPQRPYRRDESKVDYTVFAMSDEVVRDWHYALAACAGRRFSPEQGWARLLSSNMAGVGPDLMNAVRKNRASRDEFVSCLLSIFIKMVSSDYLPDSERACSYDVRSEHARRHLYDLMLLWIRNHFGDSMVTAGSLARAFGVSVRYVHKLFAMYSEKRGFLKHLQDARLECVTTRLRDQDEAHVTISEIAWNCGFADAGSFSRLFKKRYGVSPSAYRNSALSGVAESSGPDTDDPQFVL